MYDVIIICAKIYDNIDVSQESLKINKKNYPK